MISPIACRLIGLVKTATDVIFIAKTLSIISESATNDEVLRDIASAKKIGAALRIISGQYGAIGRRRHDHFQYHGPFRPGACIATSTIIAMDIPSTMAIVSLV